MDGAAARTSFGCPSVRAAWRCEAALHLKDYPVHERLPRARERQPCARGNHGASSRDSRARRAREHRARRDEASSRQVGRASRQEQQMVGTFLADRFLDSVARNSWAGAAASRARGRGARGAEARISEPRAVSERVLDRPDAPGGPRLENSASPRAGKSAGLKPFSSRGEGAEHGSSHAVLPLPRADIASLAAATYTSGQRSKTPGSQVEACPRTTRPRHSRRRTRRRRCTRPCPRAEASPRRRR